MVASVLSGNRNFEGRINSEVRANYLMSPPLVVAFALAGRIDIDLRKDAIGKGKTARQVYLADIWPTQREIEGTDSQFHHLAHVPPELRRGLRGRRALARAARSQGETYAWEKRFDLHSPGSLLRRHECEAWGRWEDIRNARCVGGAGR